MEEGRDGWIWWSRKGVDLLFTTVKHVQLNSSLCELTRNNHVSAPSETTSPCGLIRTSSRVTCILMHLLYFLDYFSQVLLISDHTYPRVQYEDRNKMRAGSVNFSLVQCALQSRVRHRKAHE